MPPVITVNRLCLAIARRSPAEMLDAVQRAQTLADVIEIRLDALTDRANLDQVISSLLTQSRVPLLFTNRPTWEGGAAAEAEEDRIRPLLTALAAGAAYVDIELRTAPELRSRVIEAARKATNSTAPRLNPPPSTSPYDATGRGDQPDANDHGTSQVTINGSTHCGQVIVSWHDFHTTPTAPALREILAQMQASGADIGKIVTMTSPAGGPTEVRRLLALLEDAAAAEFPLIAFCMGESGKISRLATGFLGGYMTYAAEADGPATAPGQLTAQALRQAEKLLTQ